MERIAAPAPAKAQVPGAQVPEAQGLGKQESPPEVIDLSARQAAAAGTAITKQRAGIELAFDNGTAGDDTGAEDVAFQVTLPRSVVRQIRVLAAKKETTQRAIVLRALRLAGLRVPEGTDVDRRGRAAKHRQQA